MSVENQSSDNIQQAANVMHHSKGLQASVYKSQSSATDLQDTQTAASLMHHLITVQKEAYKA